MNKKMKKLKKEIKRNMRDIAFKKSCKDLKEEFLLKEKTAIFNKGFNSLWVEYPQPEMGEIENGYVVDNTNTFLPLSVEKATKRIIELRKHSKVAVSCYNFREKEESWFTI